MSLLDILDRIKNQQSGPQAAPGAIDDPYGDRVPYDYLKRWRELNPPGGPSLTGARGVDGGNDVVGPGDPAWDASNLANQEDAYNLRRAEWTGLRDTYDDSVRDLGYSNQAYDRTTGKWEGLESQRASGGGYEGGRFYANGQIYTYDPADQSYTSNIGGERIKAPDAYEAPGLTRNPGTYASWMGDDPYYQLLQDPTNPDNPNYIAPPPPKPEPEPEPKKLTGGSLNTYTHPSMYEDWFYGTGPSGEGNGSG